MQQNGSRQLTLSSIAFPDGSSALLLHLAGTLPVNFRGNMYRFPISIWIPHAYPREPPLVYVTPTETIMVRPGQHVDPQGQVYHPYLVGWAQFWDVRPIAVAPGKQADGRSKADAQGAEIKFAGLRVNLVRYLRQRAPRRGEADTDSQTASSAAATD